MVIKAIQDEGTIQLLTFLSDPAMHYQSWKSGQSTLNPVAFNMLFGGIDERHSSVFKERDLEGFETRREYKDMLDKISAQAQKLLDNKDGMSAKAFNLACSAIRRELQEISKFRKNVLPEVNRDNTENGMFQKYFEGSQTLESMFLGISQTAIEMLSPQKKHGGKH